MPEKANAMIYRLSEFGALSQRIAQLRDFGATAMAKYQTDLREYQKKRRGRPEVRVKVTTADGMFSRQYDGPGYTVEHMGQTLKLPRPTEPHWSVWEVSHASTFMGCQDARSEYGLVADGGKYNRPVNEQRVNQYQKLMRAGRWHDLLSDPIAITSDGEVVNGQHRLAAGAGIKVTFEDGKEDDSPRFLVLFDVSRDEVAFADTSMRTGRDLTVIAQKGVAE
jgi:hypothetical protein